jgi:hypothetical protein
MGIGDLRLAARAEMCARIDTIARAMMHLSPDRLADELDGIRRTADRHGMAPVLTVVHAMEYALARGERGPMVLSWLDTLRDACDCDRIDSAASEAFAAAISVRLG